MHADYIFQTMKTTVIFIFILVGVVMAIYNHNLYTNNDSEAIVIDDHTVNVKRKTMEAINSFPPVPKTMFESIIEFLSDDLIIAVTLTYLSLVATAVITVIYRRAEVMNWIHS